MTEKRLKATPSPPSPFPTTTTTTMQHHHDCPAWIHSVCQPEEYIDVFLILTYSETRHHKSRRPQQQRCTLPVVGELFDTPAAACIRSVGRSVRQSVGRSAGCIDLLTMPRPVATRPAAATDCTRRAFTALPVSAIRRGSATSGVGANAEIIYISPCDGRLSFVRCVLRSTAEELVGGCRSTGIMIISLVIIITVY